MPRMDHTAISYQSYLLCYLSRSLSALKIRGVSEADRCIHVHGLDLLDGTPVLDIKPYVPYCDAFGSAAAGIL